MKIWETTHVYDHPWERVAHAAIRKYPNPLKPEVRAIDVLQRSVGSDGILRSSRLFQSQWDVPRWVTGLIGLRNPAYSHEASEIDPVKREMTLKTVNLDCTTFIAVDESMTYSPHPVDDQKTIMVQTTEITMFNVPWVSRLEQMMIEKFANNSGKGPKSLEWVIDNFRREYDEIAEKMHFEVNDLSMKFDHTIDEVKDFTHKIDSKLDEISSTVEKDFTVLKAKLKQVEARSKSVKRRHWTDTGDIRLSY